MVGITEPSVVLAEEELTHLHDRIRLLGGDSFVEKPFGPTDQCLTPAEFVEMLEDGVAGPRREHVVDCVACLRSVGSLGSIRLHSSADFVSRSLAAARRQVSESSTETVSSIPEPLLALIGVTQPLVRVDLNRASISFGCELIPAFRLSDAQRPTSLMLTGALQSETAEVSAVDVTQDGTPDIFPLQFANARLDPRVRLALKEEHPVTARVVIRGMVSGQAFAAQAQLRFASV